VKFRRRKRAWAILSALVLCWPFCAWAAAKILIVKSPLAQPDALSILSGSSSYKERAFRTAQLYREFPATRIILTNDGYRGSWYQVEQRNPFYYEYALMALTQAGVPKDVVTVLSEPVGGTHDEAVLVRRYAEREGLRKILVVTSAYHSRRALWTFRRVFDGSGISVGIEVAEVGWQTPKPATWWLHARGWQIVPAEYIKLIYYWIRF
jgi:uncharacterized SAM-binding protein YcdF (DUF218 family)